MIATLFALPFFLVGAAVIGLLALLTLVLVPGVRPFFSREARSFSRAMWGTDGGDGPSEVPTSHL